MGQIVTLRCAGLMTDQHPLNAPPGALRVADDVIFERPGVASKRPGFNAYDRNTSPGAYRPRALHAYLDKIAVTAWDGTTGWSMEMNGAPVTGGHHKPIDLQCSWPQSAEARQNLYWCSEKGPYKLTSTSDTTAQAAGMHEAPSGRVTATATGTPVVLLTNYSTAYRWCFRKLDANGVETRSAPTPWQMVSNSSGGTRDYSWLIPLPAYVAAGDQIELYRAVAVSPVSTAIPSDTMYLTVKHIVTAGEVSGGFASITDRVPESALGQELYTNWTREGALKSNGRPPASVALAQWADCMWYGYMRGPWTGVLDIATVSGATATDGLTGLQRLSRVCDTTDLSAVITNLASTTSIKVGQLITSTGNPGTSIAPTPQGLRVLSKTATTVTATAPLTGTLVGTTLYFHDGITVDGLTYWASDTTSTTVPTYPSFAVTSGDRNRDTARALAVCISEVSSSVYAFAIEDPYYRDATGTLTQASVAVRSVDLDDAQWAITFIADTSSNPPAVTFSADASGGLLVDRVDMPNGLAYSKPFEPEHVPEVNYFTVGNEADPIYALTPLRAALLVFKRDGIYRVTGSGPDSWRVDLIEPGARILRGECVSVVDGEACVWTERGVLMVNEAGARNISEGAIGREVAEFAQYIFIDEGVAAWVAAWPARNCVLVGVPMTENDAASSAVYCYHTVTRAWSRWTAPTYCARANGQTAQFYMARGGAYWEIRSSSVLYNAPTGYDRSHSISGWTYTAGSTSVSVSDAQRSEWEPKVGDWLSCIIEGTTEYRRITAVEDAGASYTLTIASAFSAGVQTARFAYEGIISKLEWQGHIVGPARRAHVSEMHVQLDWTSYTGTVGGSTARMVLGMASDINPTRQSVTSSTITRAARTVDVRVYPARDVADGAHFLPYFESDDIGLEWRCLGVTLEVEPVSERTGR